MEQTNNDENHTVALCQIGRAEYPEDPPFHPSESYPEYIFKGWRHLSSNNSVYKAVRGALHLLGLDEEHYGTPIWNPLGNIIRPGNKVVLKPNFVRDYHEHEDNLFCVITHPSVIRAILDYVYIALQGDGQIIIADAPQGDANFENLLEKTKVDSIADLYERNFGFHIPVLDLRKMRYEYNKDGLTTRNMRFELEGDPLGYASIDLGTDSEFANLESYERIYGADYDREETQKHHSKTVNEYLVSKTILSADIIISIPKLKVHKKAGITLNLKNMVGINGDKNWLPHFRIGSPLDGGDEMPQNSVRGFNKVKHCTSRMLIDRFLAKGSLLGELLCKTIWWIYKNLKSLRNLIGGNSSKQLRIQSGDWYGNDTIWRTILDLNKIVTYADKDGNMRFNRQRKFFSVVDGVIGGEGEGPMKPLPNRCGIVIAGLDPIAVDLVSTTLMGFDYRKIPQFAKLLDASDRNYQNCVSRHFPQIKIASNVLDGKGLLDNSSSKFPSFIPPRGWVGHIELGNDTVSTQLPPIRIGVLVGE